MPETVEDMNWKSYMKDKEKNETESGKCTIELYDPTAENIFYFRPTSALGRW